jgi:hypothetical protein
MTFLVRKGTRILVRKPSGEVLEHTCRADKVFQPHQIVAEVKDIQFKQDDFVVTVDAREVVEVSYRCPQCSRTTAVEGLCDECRLGWLPGR